MTSALLVGSLEDCKNRNNLKLTILDRDWKLPQAKAVLCRALNDQFSLCVEGDFQLRCVHYILKRAAANYIKCFKS